MDDNESVRFFVETGTCLVVPAEDAKRMENKRKSVAQSSTIIASTIRSPFILTWIGLGRAFDSCMVVLGLVSWANMSTLNCVSGKQHVWCCLVWHDTQLICDWIRRNSFISQDQISCARVFFSSLAAVVCMKNASTAKALMRQLVTPLNPEPRSTSREQMHVCVEMPPTSIFNGRRRSGKWNEQNIQMCSGSEVAIDADAEPN